MHKVPQQSPSSQSSCPVKSTAPTPPQISSSTLSKLNPLNYMPQLSQSRAPNQSMILPTSREASTIPRGDAEANWEYPSPQQMYNAMLRKGYDDTPVDAVESMVAIHNFLNEGAWAEIVAWERRFGRGLSRGWQYCKFGEERFEEVLVSDREPVPEPRLLRFQGRPKDMTPKAKILQALGQVYPSRFRYVPFLVLTPIETFLSATVVMLHSIGMTGLYSDMTQMGKNKNCDMLSIITLHLRNLLVNLYSTSTSDLPSIRPVPLQQD